MPESEKVQLSKDPAVESAIKEERVFHAVGLTAFPGNEKEKPSLSIIVPIQVAGMDTVKGSISLDEADLTFKPRNMNYLVGTDVVFVVTGVDDERNTLVCSRKSAQEKNKATMLADFTKGDTFEGRITGFTDFGAFVDVNGVSGMLRNIDYSTDHSRVQSRYSQGDLIKVRCKSITQEGGRVYWEVPTKYHRTAPVVCDVEEGSVTVAKIIDIRTFEKGQGVFVKLADNSDLDVLCPMPRNIPELQKGISVVIRIMRIERSENALELPRIRGMILGLAQA